MTQGNFKQINDPAFLARLLTSGPDKQNAFRKLVETMNRPLMVYIRRHVSAEDDAREVLQEGYIGVFKNLPSFKGKSTLTTWIYGIIHLKICDLLSVRSRRYAEYLNLQKSAAETEISKKNLSTTSEWETQPDRLLHIHRAMQLIYEAAGRLSDNLKEAYTLRDVDGLNCDEVSDLLEISRDAERVRIFRARNQIVCQVKKSFASAKPEYETAANWIPA